MKLKYPSIFAINHFKKLNFMLHAKYKLFIEVRWLIRAFHLLKMDITLKS